MQPPAKFRKKPVVIEAMTYDGTQDGMKAVLDWINQNGGSAKRGVWPQGPVIFIETLEGAMAALSGDWIIKGVQGEFYPCKNDIFEQIYEPAEE